MERCKLMFARRISEFHLRMQDDLCEATNPIRIRRKRALGCVYISRYHHTRIGAAMQEPQHMARRNRVQQHVFRIIQAAITAEHRRR